MPLREVGLELQHSYLSMSGLLTANHSKHGSRVVLKSVGLTVDSRKDFLVVCSLASPVCHGAEMVSVEVSDLIILSL